MVQPAFPSPLHEEAYRTARLLAAIRHFDTRETPVQPNADSTPTLPPRPWYRHLYVQVVAAIVLGVLLGHFYPATGAAMKPLGDAFIKLVKMIITPVIFLTIVTGIAGWRT